METLKAPETQETYNPSQVAITVTTRYAGWHAGEITDIADVDKVRGNLGLEFIHKAVSLGHPVVVVDGGSSEEFLSQLPHDSIHLVRFTKNNFGLQKKEALEQAAKIPGTKVVFRIEPEKVDMINHLKELCIPILTGEADVVVGNRKEEEFKQSYPDYGYGSETKFNTRYNYILRKVGLLPKDQYLDLYSGAIAVKNRPEVMKPFMQRYAYNGPRTPNTREFVTLDGWSNAQVFGIILALNQKLKVKGVEIPFRYSETQKANEEDPRNKVNFIEKRRKQRLGGLTEGILLVRSIMQPHSPKNQLTMASPMSS